jgi:multiple RNA-binding domain-containing protein 1
MDNIGKYFTAEYIDYIRGFAFIEFISVEEAKNAFTSLGNTHLYGRKLNMEFAAEEENSMEEIQKKIKV